MAATTLLQAQMLTSIASLVLSAALVIVTYLYYKETSYQTKPVLKPTVDKVDGMLTRFAIENTGNGAAHDVIVQFGFRHLDYRVDWEMPLITPGDRHIFYLPFDSDTRLVYTEEIANEIGDSKGIIEFESMYTDAFGRPETNEEQVDVLKVLNLQEQSSELVNKDEVREVRRELKKIRKIAENL